MLPQQEINLKLERTIMLEIGGISIVEAAVMIAAIVWGVYSFIYKKILENNERKGYYFRRNIEKSIRLREEIMSIYNSCDSDSVNLLHAHNHDILRPEQPWYVTVLYFYPEQPDNQIKTKWIEIEIDSAYKRMLKQLIKHKILLIETEDLPDDCKLKNAYETLGIKSSLIISLTTTKKSFVYLSINFNKKVKQNPELMKMLMSSRSKIIQYVN